MTTGAAWSSADHAHMAQALRLAELGLYTTTPNPRVGCVIVRNGTVVGTGWHRRAGEAHAEIHALREAGERARGATVYVTLEPCSHHGRTPPCADALIAASVGRVVVAMADPNPLVAGQGLARLAAAGIDTACGLLESAARRLNPGFIHRMTHQRPWLRIKTATSLDGRTALANGVSQWITGNEARLDAHRLRARSCAVLTGIGTVLADNPQLTVRGIDPPRQPAKIIVDSHLRTPPDAQLLQSGNVLIAHNGQHAEREAPLRDAGAQLLAVPGAQGRVDLPRLFGMLAQHGYNEITAEAGSTLNGALIAARLADEWIGYFAPMLLGNQAQGLFALPSLVGLADATRLHIGEIVRIGQDWRLTAHFVPTPR